MGHIRTNTTSARHTNEMAATITAKQQQQQQQDSMKHRYVGSSGGDHGDELDRANKIDVSRESSLSDKANDDDDCGEILATKTTKTTTSSTAGATSSTTQYDVEHLATFSTASSHETAAAAAAIDNDGDAQDELEATNFKLNNHRRVNSGNSKAPPTNPSAAEPRVALQKLFELEKLSGIWTQRMQIELRDDFMLILDCETNSFVERFHRDRVYKPESFHHYNDIYNNIIVFTIVDLPAVRGQDKGKSRLETTAASNSEDTDTQDSDDQIGDTATSCDNLEQPTGELHIFQCVSHKAQQLVSDIVSWKYSKDSVEHSRQVANEQCQESKPLQSASVATNDKMIKKKTTASATAPGANQSLDLTTSDSSTSLHKQQQQQQQQQDRKNKSNASKKPSLAAGEDSNLSTSTSGGADMRTNRVPVDTGTSAPVADDNGASKPIVAVTVTSSSATLGENVPLVNVNVKETVQVFNQIAALREKGSGTNLAARPVSLDNSSSSQQSGPTGAATTTTTATTTATTTTPTSDSSRVSVLSPGGQFYKQRSIRATLAPKLGGTDELPGGKLAADQAGGSSSTSSSMASSSELNNRPIVTAAPVASSSSASSSASSSSRLEHCQQHHNHNRSSKVAPPSSNHKNYNNNHHNHNNHRNSEELLANGKQHHHSHQHHQLSHSAGQAGKQIGHTNSNGVATSYAQSNPSSYHHHHKHHNHHHQQQQAMAKEGTKLSSKLSSSSSSSSSAATATAAASAAAATRPHSSSNNNGSLLHQHHSSSDFSQHSHASPSSQQSLGQLQQQPTPLEQVTTNESYVSVLNHCFDDIEKFIIRLQQAYAAMRELQAKRRLKKKSNHQLALAAASASQQASNKLCSNGQAGGRGLGGGVSQASLTASELNMLSAQARGPVADDFFEILSKFKLAFNLLAKLKGCIHEPNAPELVHFLFTPLAIIIESARNVSPPVDPTVVGIPYLNRDALDLLSNCCTSKESDLWLSLGPNWTQTIEPSLLKASRLPSSFQPIFSDGWAPVISELELIGLVVAPSSANELDHYRSTRALCGSAPPQPIDPNEPAFVSGRHGVVSNKNNHSHSHHHPQQQHHSHSSRASREQSLGISEPSVKSLSSAGMHIGNNKALKKRNSPTGGSDNSRHYLDPAKSRLTSPTPYGYTQEPAELIGNRSHMLDPAHSDPSWIPKMPSNHRSARHSAPMGGRRQSDFPGDYGHFSPQMGGYIEDADHANYLTVNPSDDYTELNEDCHDDNLPPSRALLAGSSSRRRGPNVDDYLPAYAAGERSSVPTYNYRYLPEAPFIADQYSHDHTTAEREAMLADLGPAQTEWFYELSSRGALIVRVLFARDANNDKELTVKRGEILEILDDSRKWWKARNIKLQVAYVPHTIVAVMEHYQTLDELLTNSPGEIMLMPNDDQNAFVNSQRYARRELQVDDGNFNQILGSREDKRNSKTAGGAFRYF